MGVHLPAWSWHPMSEAVEMVVGWPQLANTLDCSVDTLSYFPKILKKKDKLHWHTDIVNINLSLTRSIGFLMVGVPCAFGKLKYCSRCNALQMSIWLCLVDTHIHVFHIPIHFLFIDLLRGGLLKSATAILDFSFFAFKAVPLFLFQVF